MTLTVLEKIVKEAKSFPSDPAAVAQELKSVEASIRNADAFVGEFLGIEQRSKERLEIERENLNRRLVILAERKKGDQHYPPISLEGLRKHRTKDGWPSVAIFSLDSPDFKLQVKGRWKEDSSMGWGSSSYYSTSTSITPKLPKALEKCYEDVVDKLRKRCKSEQKSFKLTAAFDGLIPLDVKKKIAAARPAFEQIFILAEPSRWSLTSTAVVQPGDPLVVGWDGANLHLIAEFDTTPVEEALMLEGPANKGD